MRDENHIRTLGDYSKPSHESYRNTIELPIGNNVVPLWSEDPNQHLKDLLKLVDSLDLNGENRERMRLRLFQFSIRDQASNWLERLPTGSITTWEDLTTRFLAQFFPPGRTTKLRNNILMFQQHYGESLYEAWTRWNDAFVPEDVSIDYENPDIEQLLRIMEHKVDTLMKDAISLMGKSKSVFRLATNEMYRPPSEPSHQEEFEHIVMNFVLDQEERTRQLEDYMKAITDEFMEFSSEVTQRLKERIKENENKPRKIIKITRYPDIEVLENNTMHDFSKNPKKNTFPNPTNLLYVRYVQIITLNPPQPQKNTFGFKPGKKTNQSHHNLSDSLTAQLSVQTRSTRGYASSSRNEIMEEKVRMFELFDNEDHQMNYNNLARRSIHSEDVLDWELLSNKDFAQYDPLHKDVTFRLGGVEREMPLLEFGWRVVLYSEMESRDVATVSGLRNAETVNATHLTHMFWPTIGDGGYNVRKIKAKSIRNPRIKLAHRCITMTITGRKETTNHVTEIDLFYLYCIFREGVVCNIPYWLANVLNRKTPSHVYRKTSLIKMGVIMELYEVSVVGRLLERLGEGGGNDEEGDGEGGNEGIGGSVDIYRNMSQGDWQVHQARWMDQQDELGKD
ncbi:zinc finger, CCHC-type containing protein [Tanacetum coccineum]|uniref:Zinc finger, CCHC-type containing protein n=1 Tax=Tanacetum coccineum TaxID=301880 RepID=A0ABQ4WI92_9ASTR